jgi:hypothetical protein
MPSPINEGHIDQETMTMQLQALLNRPSLHDFVPGTAASEALLRDGATTTRTAIETPPTKPIRQNSCGICWVYFGEAPCQHRRYTCPQQQK